LRVIFALDTKCVGLKKEIYSMGFLIKYNCGNCGFKSPGEKDILIDPLGMPELYICSCKECKSVFHRKKDSCGNVINECPKCGNKNIEIHEDVMSIPCPSCGNKVMYLECIGNCF
jgi:predicted RNA-binding Zn-ribbon protein involved in translation (DUF1610 family)